jgi:hypothetical protein
MWSRQRFQQMRWGIFAGVAFLVTLAVFPVAHSVSGAQRALKPTATASDLVPNPVQRTPGVGPVYPYPPGVQPSR